MLRKPKKYEDLLELQREYNKLMLYDGESVAIKVRLDCALGSYVRDMSEEPEKELEYITEMVFFLIQFLNDRKDEGFEDTYEFKCKDNVPKDVIYSIQVALWDWDIEEIVSTILTLIHTRGYTTEDILNSYWARITDVLELCNMKIEEE